MNKLFYVLAFTFLHLSLCGVCVPQHKPIDTGYSPKIQQLTTQIDINRYFAALTYLGSDALEGRATGRKGERLAATYLVEQLSNAGLTPVGEEGTYFQSIPMHGSIPKNESRFLLQQPDNMPIELKLTSDYLLYHSGAQTFIPNMHELIFAGYGIVAPEFDYNDYLAIDVEDKIVVFLDGEPYSEDSNFFNGAHPTIHGYPDVKQRVALARGAVGTILMPNPRISRKTPWQYWVNQFAFEHVTLFYTRTGNFNALMNPDKCDLLFTGAAYSLEDIYAMVYTQSVRSFPLAVKASFRGTFNQRDFLANNVVAKIPGTDPELRDETVLVSAHYDHLGISQEVEGDSIYNGVIDNASGTAATLEIARVLSSNFKPKRSILFLFTTGEEKGMLGSQFYVDHPIVPLYKTIANINIDGIAIFDTFHDVVGVGKEYSTFTEYLNNFTSEIGMSVSPIPEIFVAADPFITSDPFSESDQFAFAQRGVPSILIMEGSDYKNISDQEGLQKMIAWGIERYHTPYDDLHQPMNLNAIEQHCQILLALVASMANTDYQIKWKPNSPFFNARLRSIAEQR